jgi:hypothetical protein
MIVLYLGARKLRLGGRLCGWLSCALLSIEVLSISHCWLGGETKLAHSKSKSHRHHMCLSDSIKIMIKPPLTSSRNTNDGVYQVGTDRLVLRSSFLVVVFTLPMSEERIDHVVAEISSTYNLREGRGIMR